MAERRQLRAADFVPVEAKFQPSVRRVTLVPRGHLLDRLLESADRRVVLVTAPAGYGKTVLASQWAAEDPRPFAWLTLDAADDDPPVLVTYLLLALQRVEAVDRRVLSVVNDAGAALVDFGRMLRQRRRPFVLVLDGVDALSSSGAFDVLRALVEHLPIGSQLVLVGRTAPALDWDDVREQQGLLELDTHDLRFSRVEAQALLACSDGHQSEQDVDTLLASTEGWAAGLYLAALATETTPDVAAAVSSDSLVADYLREELLAGLRPDDLNFLVRTSILSRLCGPLCDAVAKTTGSAGRLARLAASNVLLDPLEVGSSWYRLHPLLAGLLRSELRRREPGLVKVLHTRAGLWFEAHDAPEEAVASAIAAGEVERAAGLIWRQVPQLLAAGRCAVMEGWLERFSSRQLVGQTELALTAAWCAVQRGQDAEHWLAAAERGQYDAADKQGAASKAAATALLRAVLARHGLVQMGADAQLALRLQEPEDAWASRAGVLDAVSTYLTGSAQEARDALQRVERLAAATGAHDARALALGELAVIAEGEDPATAQVLVDEAVEVMREHGLQGFAMLLPVHCLSSLLAVRRRGPQEAAELVQRCLRQLGLAGPPAPWAVVQCRQLLARAHLLLGDPAAARTTLSEAQSLLSAMPDAVVLHARTEQIWREIERLPLQGSVGTSTLTSAELRILQYLPTHLSFEEIGRELFVSRNTVKTQAMAAYRKLGVSSRGEAVERAGALGLLSG